MANLVKYHNDINRIPLRNFNEKELNLFFSLIFKAKEEGIREIKINFTDLRKISNGPIHSERFIKSLKNLNNKLLDLKQEITLSNGDIFMFNLFNKFLISPKRKIVEIQINEEFYYMLNDLLVYTKFELTQLVRLRSSYSKNVFRLLKQFESTNIFSIYIDEFRRILCVPESYEMRDLNKRVLKPAMEELSTLFPNLKLQKIKDGRKIKTLKFTWNNYCSLGNKKSQSAIEIKISEGLNKVIERVKKNRFIEHLLNISNIEKLVKKYPEKELKKGLKFAVKEIKYEIKSLSYLEKTIDTGIKNSGNKILVIQKKSDIIPDENNLINEDNNENISKERSMNSKSITNPVRQLKGDLAKWCIKNKKYTLFGELEDIYCIRELDKFLEKHNIEI